MAAHPRILIFYTTTYPYGIVETFIETELPFLSQKFDKIIIVTNYMVNDNMRPIPHNALLLRKPYFANAVYKLRAALMVANKNILEEIGNIKNNLKLPLSKPVLSILFGSIANGLSFSDFTEKLIEEHQLQDAELHLYSYWLNDAALGIAFYKLRHPEVKGFCRAHRWDIYQNDQPHSYAAMRPFIFKNLDCCYAISSGGEAYLNFITKNKYANKIKIARLGTLPHTTTEYNTPKQKFRLLSCSYVIPRKRIQLVIEALGMLSHLHIEWVHLGGGPVFNEIQALAQNTIKGNVSFDLKGLMNHDEIQAYYHYHPADLFINVSESEGVPVSIMEANSYGIPAISTNTGGVADITNNDNGFLIDVNVTAKDIASTIEYYYNLPDADKAQYRHNAFTTWDTLYNAPKNYTAFVNGVINL